MTYCKLERRKVKLHTEQVHKIKLKDGEKYTNECPITQTVPNQEIRKSGKGNPAIIS